MEKNSKKLLEEMSVYSDGKTHKMSNGEFVVSMFANVRSNTPIGVVELFKYLNQPLHKIGTENLRNLADDTSRKKFKETLTCITPSGNFSVRNLEGLIKHSGFIGIDIDGKDNTHISDFALLRNELSKIINIAYCSLSVSGNGVFCLIPIKNVEKHKEHFNALQKEFLNLGIVIDKSCSDVTRLRIGSYDENAYTNKNAIIYSKELISHIQKIQRAPPQKRLASPKRTSGRLNTQKRVIEIITVVEKKSFDMTGDYTQWFQLGCALANEFGEEGRDFFHSISQYHPKYSERRTDTLYSSCLGDVYSFSIGTFFYWAEKYDLS